MPFCTVKWPAVGLSLLKPGLQREGIKCDIRYLNIVFAKMAGMDIYEKICEHVSDGGDALIGERLFAQEYFYQQLPDESEYTGFLKKVYSGPREYLDQILSTKKLIKPFLDYCIESIKWESYDIVGFTTMFEQNLASLSLAREIKQRYPDKIIVFGGANCEGEMGHELHRSFPFIDFICSGEADFSFPELVKRISQQKPVKDIAGIIYRRNGDSLATEESWPVNDLDTLPYPDYNDYFNQIGQSAGLLSMEENGLPMETSRGCWWGAKSKCRFCGLNGQTIHFRSKGKDRVINELKYLCERYNAHCIQMVDNILDMNYFRELLPDLGKEKLPIQIFYEVKANLTKEQISILHDAGVVWIQPGIESLNTHTLKLIAKGVSALQNIQLLRNCLQAGIDPVWNLIHGFPGERAEDNKNILETIYKIIHLPPPGGYSHFELHRFSPYFIAPEKFGLSGLRPKESYRYVYPFEQSQTFNLAYFFDFDYREDVRPPDYDGEFTKAVNYWQESYANGDRLYVSEKSPSTLVIEDMRSNAVTSRAILENFQKEMYEYCDSIRSFSSIYSYICQKYSDTPIRERDVRDFLQEMNNLNFMVNEDDKYLSLAVNIM